MMRTTLGALGLLAMMAVSGAAWAGDKLAVDVDGVDAPRVRSAVEREVAEISPPPRGRLSVTRTRPDAATIVYESEDGERRLERTIDLQDDPEEAADEIALVAASLARDEPETRRPRAAIPMPAPRPAVREPVPARRRAPRLLPGRELCKSRPATVPFGLDFAPYVGTSSSATARASNRFMAVNVVGGIGASLAGVEAGFVNVETDYMCGAQAASIANVVAGDVLGLQVAGIANVATGALAGAQVAGIANVVDQRASGIQVAGIANVAADRFDGAQIGLVNVAARKVRGIQVGLVNVAEKSDLSIGLVSINTKGRAALELSSNVEVGLVALTIKHGGDHWHGIYGVATRLTSPTPAPVLGIGGHFPLGPRLFLDVDATATEVFSLKKIDKSTFLAEARPLLGYKIADRFALVGGPSWNVLTAQKPAVDWSPGYAKSLGSNTTSSVRAWPGGVVGVQALSD